MMAEETIKVEEDTDEDEFSDEGDESDKDDPTDKYYEDIEFSNACRRYYIARVASTESFKENISKDDKKKKKEEQKKKRTSIDDAMEKLRKEMASLMDQDLVLMEKFLTLNETLEDIKVQRGYGSSRDSFMTSSCDIYGDSHWSLTGADDVMMGNSNADLTRDLKQEPSSLSTKLGTSDKDFSYFKKSCHSSNDNLPLKTDESFDSGYNSPKYASGRDVGCAKFE